MKNHEYQTATKQWSCKFQELEQLQARQLQSLGLLKNPSMHGYVKDSLFYATMLRQLAIESRMQEIDLLTEQTKSIIQSADSMFCDERSSGIFSRTTAESFSDNGSVLSNSDIKSVSSMTEVTSSTLQSPKNNTLSDTTEEIMSYTSAVKGSMQLSKQFIAKSESDANLGITKFQARFRGGVIRDNLSQIQAEARYKKDAQDDIVQKLVQQRVDEENAKKVTERKKIFLEQQQLNLNLQIKEKQKKLSNIAQNIANKKNEEDFVLQLAIEDKMLESFVQAQSLTIHGLSSKEKKTLKPLQKSIKNELFNFCNVDDKVAVDKLNPIVMECLQKEGFHYQGLSNWLVKSAVRESYEGFDLCVQDCGASFDGMKVFSRIVQPSIGKDRLNQLKDLNCDKKLQLSDGQIDTIMEIEKQLLLVSFALQYKKSLLRPYTLLTKNNFK